MAQDVGIIITQPGTDTTNAPVNKIMMNTTNPFIKLDTQKSTSFQSIFLQINTDPPEPTNGYTRTQVYKFAHTYPYIPALETLFYVSTPPTGVSGTQTYFQDSGVLGRHTIGDEASIYAVPDATYVYFYVQKYNSGTGSANLLTGTNIQITVHVFADDVGI